MRKMKKHTIKPRVAFISLTSCEGCQFVMLDQGRRFFDWLKEVEADDFRLISEKHKKTPADHYDFCFVEGNPVTPENIKLLEEMRRKSKCLIVVGNCAALGGVWELKNYQNKKRVLSKVYKKTKLPNLDIREVDNFVTVDFTIPGCPISGDEFMEYVYQLIAGRIPQPLLNPVCFECRKNGYECLLQKGEICLGPITLGGCQAVCLKSKQACWGCRGLVSDAALDNFLNYLKKNFPKENIDRILEVFGSRDSIAKAMAEKKKKVKK